MPLGAVSLLGWEGRLDAAGKRCLCLGGRDGSTPLGGIFAWVGTTVLAAATPQCRSIPLRSISLTGFAL